MARERAAAMSRLRLLKVKIEREFALLPSERNWLADVLERACNGDRDPFGIRPTGRPSKGVDHLKIAEAVFRLSIDGMPLDEAYRCVGEQFCVSGDYGGTAEKAYRKHLPMIKATDATFRSRNEGRPMTENELDALRAGVTSFSEPD